MTYEEIIKNIRQVIRCGKCDNEEIRDILISHNCYYLAKQISPSRGGDFSELACAVAVKERYKHAKPLFEALKPHPYAVIKGAVLSKQIYGSPFIRRSGDLDILIRRQDLDFVKRVLLDNGFVQGRIIDNKIVPFTRKELIFQTSQSHQAAPFVKATENKLCPFINFDMNTSVFWGEYGHECDMELVLSETEETVLFDIPFKKLSPEAEFISLCLHHYKDMNSLYLLAKGSLKLDLFCDIFYYLKNVAVDIDKLYDLSSKLNAVPYVYYCLRYTYKVFEEDLIIPFISKFESPEGTSLLSSFGLCDSERQEWKTDFWERLFSPSFCEDFYSSLGEKEREKIKTNQTLM